LVYFFAFETLAKEFLTIEKRTCKDLDWAVFILWKNKK
jgi:hypothetical protein